MGVQKGSSVLRPAQYYVVPAKSTLHGSCFPLPPCARRDETAMNWDGPGTLSWLLLWLAAVSAVAILLAVFCADSEGAGVSRPGDRSWSSGEICR